MPAQMPCCKISMASLCMVEEPTGAFFVLQPLPQSGTIVGFSLFLANHDFSCMEVVRKTSCLKCHARRAQRFTVCVAGAGSVHGSHNYCRWVPRTEEERAEQRKAARLTLDTSAHAGSEYRRLVRVLSSVRFPTSGNCSWLMMSVLEHSMQLTARAVLFYLL